MDIFSVITLVGGLAFFLYGMNVLSSGLERMAGGKMETLLKRMTANRFAALALGAGITAAIQSPSAVTVMLVGLVNSGIMTIRQSIGVIMGSNIGTTMTAWVLTLVGVESDSPVIQLMKPENFSLVFAFVGIVMIMAAKKDKAKDIGSILVGFAILMYGMKLMSGAVKPLAEVPAFTSLITAFKNPILGVLAGIVITAVIQSSSASVGILQALALTGAVSYGAAIPVIMGQNIGTCVTALISSIGVSRNAKKVAVVHISFNLIGTAVCLIVYCTVNSMFHMPFVDQSIDAVGIASVHSAFNLVTTAMLIPFVSQLEKIANYFLPEQEETHEELLDRRLMVTPSVAITECDNLANKMAELSRDTLQMALGMLEQYDPEAEKTILEQEDALDRYEDALGSYLVQMSAKRLSKEDSLKVSKMLHAIGDFERLGDHGVNLLYAAKELHEKNLQFSQEARGELGVLFGAIREILNKAENSYTTGSLETAVQVEPLEQTVDTLVATIKDRHIRRLQAGECSIQLGFILSDVLNNLERVSDHCSNLAVNVLELSHSSFDTHKYISGLRSDSEQFREDCSRFAQKYHL